jgi:RecB family endonuclease NucS
MSGEAEPGHPLSASYADAEPGLNELLSKRREGENKMAIFEITTDTIRKIEPTTFDAAGLKERYDLQRLLRKQIDVIVPDMHRDARATLLVIAVEFGEWDECKRRIDLLALDKDGNLVVIELKRTEDGGHMELQAVRYASMVSTIDL